MDAAGSEEIPALSWEFNGTMKILMLHNFYQQRGGEGVSFAVEAEALRQRGHQVDTFTLDNAVDLPKLGKVGIAVNAVWSKSSFKKVKAKLQKNSYDLMHVQNFFPLLSPSVYDAAGECGVPVIQALRNYRLFCMEAGLLLNGNLCEKCIKAGSSLPGLKNRCYRDSMSASLSHSIMLEFHRLKRTWWKKVDAYIAVSDFVKGKYVEAGWSSESVFVKHNSVLPEREVGSGEGNFFVTAGRLSEDKGLDVIVQAWQELRKTIHASEMPVLKIIGDGPLHEYLRSIIENNKLESCIKLTGRLSLSDTYKQMGEARAIILPSVRHEPCSRTIAESYAKGTPVIASSIGGNTELVEHEISGYQVLSGNVDELVNRVRSVMTLPESEYNQLRRASRLKFDREFAPDVNAQRLEKIYKTVCEHGV